MAILNRLSTIRDLPTIPEMVVKVQNLIQSGESNAATLAELLGHDPALAARILKVANSAFYGGGNQRISSMTLAITRIGFLEVGNIALAASLVRQFRDHGRSLNTSEFWTHSLAAAYLSTTICAASALPTPAAQREQLFIAALLHDIGLLIYDQFFANEFRVILDYAAQTEKSYLAAEEQRAGSESHPHVGAALLEMWRLDTFVVNAVRYHHDVARAPQTQRGGAAVVALAEYILCNRTMGSFEGMSARMDPQLPALCGIGEHQLAGLFESSEMILVKAAEILGNAAGAAQAPLRFV